MTRREIFLQADPREVNDAYCRRFTYPYRIEGAFNICKGLKFFARGERYDEPWEAAIERIMNSGKKFKFTPKQAHVILTSFRGCLEAALDALGFSNAPNPDELVNEWLNQTEPDCSEDANQSAMNIISKLIQKHNERFQS
ncbi:MAG: hypothetical protein NC301_09000 [Bacteroides sp.]|nr:hypothetical protein [Alistipes timonensis]MCM1311139.1 hypothetical protein [Bacteroides sp.]MCM1406263.1 hypothetical protein [[Clostridium] fimetarium]